MNTITRDFKNNPEPKIGRSKFKQPSKHITTFDGGYIIPVYCKEVVPGDSFKMNAKMFSRMLKLKTPIMDSIKIDMHWFYCPSRLLWTNWKYYMGEEDTPGSYTPRSMPKLTVDNEAVGSLTDYFGLPIEVSNGTYQVCALPYRMYNFCWNEWYRDQNISDKVDEDFGDQGDDVIADYTLKKRAKRHDYFTSCLPWPQKGSAVEIFGNDVDVLMRTTAQATAAGGDGTAIFVDSADDAWWNPGGAHEAVGSRDGVSGALEGLAGSDLRIDPNYTLYADLTDTINDFRMALAMQRWYEIDARGGTRYREILYNHFGVISSDRSLQRPEYLGGSTFDVLINEVAATADAGGKELADLASHAKSAGSCYWSKSFEEYGYVMCLVSARADLTYYQGVDRMWTRDDREEHYWPSFANIGEQPVYQSELVVAGSNQAEVDSTFTTVFGYQERYGEYRYHKSIISGIMRPGATGAVPEWQDRKSTRLNSSH